MKLKPYLIAPAVFIACLFLLFTTWALMEPAALHHAFDNGGYSAFELATIPFFVAIVPLVWWKCPFTGSPRRRALLCAAVSCVAIMAVVKEMDLHLKVMQMLFPEIVNADGSVQGLFKPNGDPLTGTPFKMRFLTNAAVPIAAKACVVFYFSAFFGVFAALLAYFFPKLVIGFFRLHPVAWTMCCFGASGVMVQLCDRMPAWVRHARGLPKAKVVDSISSLFTAFEEGGEMMIAIFALLAIWQAHRIYFRTEAEEDEA
ncbi:MAG: hypothetical protein ACI4RA_11450 [Kiritimatiellia bacterium]